LPIYNSMTKRKILFASNQIPEFDRASGYLRLFSILEILSTSNEITFIVKNFHESFNPSGDMYVSAMEMLGIEIHIKDYDIETILKENEFDCAVLVFHHVAGTFLPLIRRLRPELPIVVDSVDVHFSRELQMAKVKQDRSLHQQALLTKKREIAIYSEADIVWTVTDRDRKILQNEIPNMAIDIIPNIHKPSDSASSKAIRKKGSLLFVGGFKHLPNEDAILFFCSEILPGIKKEIPDIHLTIAGSDPSSKVTALSSEFIEVTGYLPDIKPLLSTSYISISPLRFGGGLKGKVGEAMAEGLPVVTTPVGVQGMSVVDGKHLLIANTPEEFVAAVVRLHQNEALHSYIATNAREYINKRFSPEIVELLLGNSLKRI
jgi:O-antigen biosynthesis protein